MDKYGFNPRQLLSQVLQIYLNLSVEHDFIKAIASEGRSYKKELFEQAHSIAKRRVLKTEDELEAFMNFLNKVEEVREAMDKEEIDDFPEEFQGRFLFLYRLP